MEQKRGFGQAPAPETPPPPRPLWARPAAWALFGALLGAVLFTWSQRRGLERAARGRAPQAQAQARRLAAAAQGLAKEARGLAESMAPEPEPEPVPDGPSADTLSAPVDPSRPRRRAARAQARSLAGKRRAGERDYGSASEVRDVRARWDAPDVSYEAPVPWLETDMGRGVTQTGGLAVFFWLLGWALFRFTGGKPRTF